MKWFLLVHLVIEKCLCSYICICIFGLYYFFDYEILDSATLVNLDGNKFNMKVFLKADVQDTVFAPY